MEEPSHRLNTGWWPVGIVPPLLGAHHEEGNGGVPHAGLLALEELVEPAQLQVVDNPRPAAFAGEAGRRPGHMGPGSDNQLLARARGVGPRAGSHAEEILDRTGEEDVVPTCYVQRGKRET